MTNSCARARRHSYNAPTPIQRQAIPAVLQGGDLLGGAQTGTGKTAGFVLPMLQRLMNSSRRHRSSRQASGARLILAPTRELAAQVEESVRVYGKFLPLTSTCIFGGVGINPQIDAIRRGVDIIVATPGRLLDIYGQKAIDFSGIEILVLDEADRMLDMGFIHDIKGARGAAAEAPEPAVQRHLQRRYQGAGRSPAQQSAGDRSGVATRPLRSSSNRSCR